MSEEAGRLSPIEIATIDAIVSLFETNSPGKYDAIARSAQDRGGLSYGKHQAALVSGSLHRLISKYCSAEGAHYAERLRPYLPQMQAEDRALDSNDDLVALLVQAAADPVMQRSQDEYFSEHYMAPALREAAACGFVTPLGCAVVYDSHVHGSWEPMKARTSAIAGPPSTQNEQQWITKYLQERRAWLAGHSNALLQRTVYRMDCLLDLVQQGAWSLALPLTLRLNGFTFTLTAWDLGAHLFADPVFRADPAALGVVKARRAVIAEGRDRHVQSLLAELGLLDRQRGVDGKFGSGSAAAARGFQLSCGLAGTGEVDAATYVQLANAVQRKQGRENTEFTPLPERERNTSGAVLGGAGAVTTVGAGGAIIGADVLQHEEAATQSPAQGSPTPEQAPAPVEATSTAPEATTTAPAPTTASPQPPTHAEIQQPAPAPPEWRDAAREALPWIAIALVCLAFVLLGMGRRRAY